MLIRTNTVRCTFALCGPLERLMSPWTGIPNIRRANKTTVKAGLNNVNMLASLHRTFNFVGYLILRKRHGSPIFFSLIYSS